MALSKRQLLYCLMIHWAYQPNALWGIGEGGEVGNGLGGGVVGGRVGETLGEIPKLMSFCNSVGDSRFCSLTPT